MELIFAILVIWGIVKLFSGPKPKPGPDELAEHESVRRETGAGGADVAESSLPENVTATHRSLFDDSLQGIEVTDKPAFSFQGHPEASPGPHDLVPLFERFINHMDSQKRSGLKAVLSK